MGHIIPMLSCEPPAPHPATASPGGPDPERAADDGSNVDLAPARDSSHRCCG